MALGDRGALLAHVDRPPVAEGGAERQRDVLAHRALHQQRLGAVAGHIGDAGADGVGGMAELDRLAVDLDGAAGRADRAGERGEQLVLALAFERDDAGDLAVAEVERDIVELGADAQVADAEARRAGGRRGGLRSRVRCAARAFSIAGAEHQLDDLLLGAGRDVDDADGLAVAQHGGAVAQRRDLDEAVRDEDDGAAGLALAAHDVEHALGKVGRQRGGHLVEQQHVGLDRPARAPGRARAARPAGCRARCRGGRGRERRARAPIRGTARPACGQAKVGGDVEIGDQRRLLIDRNQPGAARIGRRAHVAGLAADQDAAGIGADRAGQDLDERRLAGAVGAHQRVHLARQHATATRCAAPRRRRSSWRRRWRRGAVLLSRVSRLSRYERGDGRPRPVVPASRSGRQIIRPGPCRRRSAPWCRWSSPGSRC